MCQMRTKNTPFPANLLSTINFYLFIIYIDPLLAEGLRASLPGVHTKNIYTFKTRPVHSTLHISEENKQRRNTSAAVSLQNMTLQIILEHWLTFQWPNVNGTVILVVYGSIYNIRTILLWLWRSPWPNPTLKRSNGIGLSVDKSFTFNSLNHFKTLNLITFWQTWSEREGCHITEPWSCDFHRLL